MNAVRALNSVRIASYDGNPSLRHFGEIEITNAAPDVAEAILQAIEACGGSARIVTEPSDASVCLLTEGLTEGSLANRHHMALQAILSAHENMRVMILDRGSAPALSDIGGIPGLCRSFRIEQPAARLTSFSLYGSSEADEGALRIIHALDLPDGDYALYADEIRQDVPGDNLLPPRATDSARTSPVWLVSGGGRGVTADCAIELANRTGGSFILLGRSDMTDWPEWLEPETDLKALRSALAKNSTRPGMPKKPVDIGRLARKLLAGAEIASTVQAIEAAGANARYVQADIADRASLRSTLATLVTEVGTFTGVVHGAGVLSDGLVDALDLKSFETVFAPKVTGLETILSYLDTRSLSHIALFSSASAVFGNQGQANYAAANAWLNNVAIQLAALMPDTQVKSFCWGPWQGGMVNDALARMFTERGIGLITRQEGARIFADQLLNSPHDQVRFVVGDEWGAQ
nr:SDR family NAD(P)-dependent oxidoreductase [uncultured Hyphomonas sp.]